MLAERETELEGEEDVAVEEVEGRVERLVEVPPENPRVQVRVARVGRVVAEVLCPGPRHRDRQREERKKDERLAAEGARPAPVFGGHGRMISARGRMRMLSGPS